MYSAIREDAGRRTTDIRMQHFELKLNCQNVNTPLRIHRLHRFNPGAKGAAMKKPGLDELVKAPKREKKAPVFVRQNKGVEDRNYRDLQQLEVRLDPHYDHSPLIRSNC